MHGWKMENEGYLGLIDTQAYSLSLTGTGSLRRAVLRHKASALHFW